MKKLLALLAMLISAEPVSAQTNCLTFLVGVACSTNATALPITITIGRAIRLVASPATTTLTAPTPAIFNAGFSQTTGPTLTMKANTPWSLAISAQTAVWSATNTGTEAAWTAKPASNLRWATSSGGTYTPFSTTPVTLSSGIATAGTNISLFYRTTYAWTTDTPGNYQLQIVLTITAP
jgi:hypothetical protein